MISRQKYVPKKKEEDIPEIKPTEIKGKGLDDLITRLKKVNLKNNSKKKITF